MEFGHVNGASGSQVTIDLLDAGECNGSKNMRRDLNVSGECLAAAKAISIGLVLDSSGLLLAGRVCRRCARKFGQ